MVSQPAFGEGDVIHVTVDLVNMKASFVRAGVGVIKTVPALAGADIYPAAAFRRVGTQISFVDPAPGELSPSTGQQKQAIGPIGQQQPGAV